MPQGDACDRSVALALVVVSTAISFLRALTLMSEICPGVTTEARSARDLALGDCRVTARANGSNLLVSFSGFMATILETDLAPLLRATFTARYRIGLRKHTQTVLVVNCSYS